MSKEINKDPLPAAVVLRRPPRGPTTRGCPHWERGVLPRQQRRSHTNPKRERGSDEIK